MCSWSCRPSSEWIRFSLIKSRLSKFPEISCQQNHNSQGRQKSLLARDRTPNSIPGQHSCVTYQQSPRLGAAHPKEETSPCARQGSQFTNTWTVPCSHHTHWLTQTGSMCSLHQKTSAISGYTYSQEFQKHCFSQVFSNNQRRICQIWVIILSHLLSHCLFH